MEFKPEDYQTRVEQVGSWKIRVTSYRLEGEFICTVDNVDPGATIVRVNAPSRAEAESQAVEKAKEKILRTKTYE